MILKTFGERGIRTLDTAKPYTPLAGERFQPLSHLSKETPYSLTDIVIFCIKNINFLIKLIPLYIKATERYNNHSMSELLQHDILLYSNYKYIIGVDEVGRGCLAGDMYIGAVCYSLETLQNELYIDSLKQINDSKKLTETKREELNTFIQDNCIYSIQQATVKEIDSQGLTKPLFGAMNKAVNSIVKELNITDTSKLLILVDGNQAIKECTYKQEIIKQGDSRSIHIASASIIAKVSRDNYMKELHHLYPEYGWYSNKGYGSKTHREALKQYGYTPKHRQLFLRKMLEEQKNEQLKLV